MTEPQDPNLPPPPPPRWGGSAATSSDATCASGTTNATRGFLPTASAAGLRSAADPC